MNFAPIEDWLELPTDSVLEVWEGLVITLQLLCGSVLLAFALALPLALAATSGKVWPARLARGYSAAFRGTPLLVQLFILFFGLPQFGILLPAFVCGVIGLGIYSGAYVSEVVRGAIQSIDKGQMEAARSIGMSSGLAMRTVVLPQAVVRMIPPLGNEFIALIKNSALVSLLTIADLMHEGQKIISVSYRSLEVYLAIAVVYFILTGVTSLVLRRMELRLRAGGMVQ